LRSICLAGFAVLIHGQHHVLFSALFVSGIEMRFCWRPASIFMRSRRRLYSREPSLAQHNITLNWIFARRLRKAAAAPLFTSWAQLPAIRRKEGGDFLFPLEVLTLPAQVPDKGPSA
jgi:hypothetical protein